MMMQTKRSGLVSIFLLLCSHSVSCASRPKVPPTLSAVSGKKQHGVASIYTDHRTASGERFSSRALTAAHPTLPMGTKVRVTCLKSGRCTVVRINDRGPFIRGRIIDLTPAAAAQIGLTKTIGLTKVELAVLH
jgi:rare lipoprotein A